MKKTGYLSVLFLVTAAALFAQAKEKADTSTAEDWKTTCSLRYDYNNKLIFSATRTTDAAGKKTYS